jgi:hypothetical protein
MVLKCKGHLQQISSAYRWYQYPAIGGFCMSRLVIQPNLAFVNSGFKFQVSIIDFFKEDMDFCTRLNYEYLYKAVVWIAMLFKGVVTNFSSEGFQIFCMKTLANWRIFWQGAICPLISPTPRLRMVVTFSSIFRNLSTWCDMQAYIKICSEINNICPKK